MDESDLQYLHSIAPTSVTSRSLSHAEGRALFGSSQTSDNTTRGQEIPTILQDLAQQTAAENALSLTESQYYSTHNHSGVNVVLHPTKVWLPPGPGRPVGSGRNLDARSLSLPISVALSHSVSEALREYCLSNGDKMLEEGFPEFRDPSLCYQSFCDWKNKLPAFSRQKRGIWSLGFFFGYPAVLLKVHGNERAVAIHSEGCSSCFKEKRDEQCNSETKALLCSHVSDFHRALSEIISRAGLSRKELVNFMAMYYRRKYASRELVICRTSTNPIFLLW